MTRPTNGSGRSGDRRRHPRNDASGPTRTLGLSPSTAGALSYAFTFVTGVALYLLAEDRFVRFHAAQSVLVFGPLAALNVGLSVLTGLLAVVPGIGGAAVRILGTIVALSGPVGVVLWLVLIYLAYRGDEYALPVVGGWARRLA